MEVHLVVLHIFLFNFYLLTVFYFLYFNFIQLYAYSYKFKIFGSTHQQPSTVSSSLYLMDLPQNQTRDYILTHLPM